MNTEWARRQILAAAVELELRASADWELVGGTTTTDVNEQEALRAVRDQADNLQLLATDLRCIAGEL